MNRTAFLLRVCLLVRPVDGHITEAVWLYKGLCICAIFFCYLVPQNIDSYEG